KASNEEITSMNEELQSTNEELETSKEEMQSFNEELHTVNNQLQHKVHELENTTNDLNNLLAGTETATVFLDTNLNVKWFTPAIQPLFNFVTSDAGRPIGHFARKFSDDNLLRDAKAVMAKLIPIEAEVPGDDGKWYQRRLLPYRTQDNRIAGVVIVFTDVTEIKLASDAVNEARIYAEAIVETIRQPLLVLDDTLRVVSANTAFRVLFHLSQLEEIQGLGIYEIKNGQWNIPRLRARLDELLTTHRHFNDVEIVHEFHGLGHRCMLLNGRMLARGGGREALILLAIEDVTARKRSEAAVKESEAQYRTLFDSIDEGFCIIEKIETGPGEPIDFRYLVANPAFEKQTGVGGVIGKTIREAFPGEPQEWFDTYDTILRDGKPLRFERALATQGRFLELYAFRLEDTARHRVAVVFQDITERKHAGALAAQLGAIVESSDDAIISTDIGGVITSWNRGAELLFGYAAGEVTGKSVTILIPPDRQGEEPGVLERIRNGQHIEHSETVRLRKDGSKVWVSLSVSPLKDAGGDVIGASKIIRDETERRRADEHRDILVRELNHRVKNTMAIVNAIATQTLGTASSLAEAKKAFEQRLMALARGHDLLTEGDWSGTDLASVARATIQPFDGDAFHIEGPFVALTPATAVTLTLALHELCTNAAKYGALSVAKGHIDIIWQVTGNGEGRRLTLCWAESGGPKVTLPAHKGFGSRLIEKALAMELSGEVRIDYENSGVVCTIDVPMPSGRTHMEPQNVRWDG
ncbi:MAG: PAS domain S-box protein, partial [Rhizobiales bacterium]|nr:PAS domain S-box protein [Hyphomicrobiales bacterium]